MRLRLGTSLVQLWVIALLALMVPAVPWVLASVLAPVVSVASAKQAHASSVLSSAQRQAQHAGALESGHRLTLAQARAAGTEAKHSAHRADCSRCDGCSQCGNCAAGSSMLNAGDQAGIAPGSGPGLLCEGLASYADHLPALRERPPRLG